MVDLALEIGREGREGHPVGTMFVVGDTRKVLTMCAADELQPVPRLQPRGARHPRPGVREQIKDIAQLEGAIIIRRDGVAVAACMRIEAPDKGFTLSKGLGTRHAAAAAISKSTKAIAVTVSQSSGTVRLFQNGEVVLHIEPLARPMIWGRFHMEARSQRPQPYYRQPTHPGRRANPYDVRIDLMASGGRQPPVDARNRGLTPPARHRF